MTTELTGYPNRFSVRQGEAVEFKISTDGDFFAADVVRLIHGDANGPGFKEELVSSLGSIKGRRQLARLGSYGVVGNFEAPREVSSFTMQLWARPTIPVNGQTQGLIRWGNGGDSFCIGLGPEGDFRASFGSIELGKFVTTGASLFYNQWYFLAVTFDAQDGTVVLHQRPVAHGHKSLRVQARLFANTPTPRLLGAIVVAASSLTGPAGREQAHGLFNGRIEAPCIFERCLSDVELEALQNGSSPQEVASAALLAHWDFAMAMEGTLMIDRGPNRAHGSLVNAPARAVTGHRWDGSEYDFKRAPQHFAAIHFHQDDLDDAEWESDIAWTVPSATRSGFYALRLRSGALEDHIPFVVCIGESGSRAKAVVLAPSMTYAAYANRTLQDLEPYRAYFKDREMRANLWDMYLSEHPELGLSIYDSHADGSPVFYSTLRRPIPNLRPKYRQWQFGTPRHLGADLYLVDWLENKGFEYDVITDHDLHRDGLALLSQYRVLLTGTHPEYWTTPMRGAIEAFQSAGGRLMYLGGNGFFWVTSVDRERPYLIEVRKGPWGPTASGDIEAERYHNTTGERGGLWRERGKPPNQIAGIGTAAMGYDNTAPGYLRQPGSFESQVSFIFEGVGADEVIGDFGLVFGGAAGDEIDRLDDRLDTPPDTILLARATGHGPTYFPVTAGVGDLLDFARSTTNKVNVRADMIYYKTPSGAETFSVGSISWCASLSHNGYANNVSQITANVLKKFLS